MTVIEHLPEKVQKMKAKKEKVIDRRIQKTKKSLTEALISLMLVKGYEKVTVQDIIDKANVGRSTFYMHYESKEQLLLDGHNNLDAGIFADDAMNDEKADAITFTKLVSHVAENHQLAKAMLGKKGGNIMTDFFKNNIALRIKKRLGSQFGKSRAQQQLLVFLSDACAAAVVSLLVSWIEAEMPFPANEISQQCQNLVTAIFEKTAV
jgi:hypothetical protein